MGIDTPLARRTFLVGAAAAAALVRAGWSPTGASAGLQPGNPFSLGVASGDPLPDRVVIWTRLAPDPIDVASTPQDTVDVTWTVYANDALTDVVATGTEPAAAAFAHSVHVDVTGLEPDTWYWYQFGVPGFESPVGQTRTAPASGCTVDQVRFGFGSCQSWTSGYYGSHRHLSNEDVDLIFFLGDYIYEGGGTGPVRSHNGGEVVTLEEYRNRYGLYKSDADLQRSHARCPWFVIWDDHEVANNYADDHPEDAPPSPEFMARRAAAYRAWWEHMPVRLPAPEGPDLTIHRAFEWGGLASWYLLDGRQYRSDQACGGEISFPCPELEDASRSMLGAEQEAWLIGALRSTSSTWNVIANQTVFSSMPFAGFLNMDQWDGYPGSRQRILDVLAEGVPNPVVITGDIHAAGVADISQDWDDPTNTVVGTELVGTSISSGFGEELVEVAEDLISSLPWVRYVNARQRGYAVVELTPERMEATFRVVDDAADPETGIATAYVHTVEAAATGQACEAGLDEAASTGATADQAVSPQYTG